MILIKVNPLAFIRVVKTSTASLRQICNTSRRFALPLPRMGSNNTKHHGLKDNIPSGYELIYRAPLSNYLSAAKNISTVSATIIALLAGYTYARDTKRLIGSPTLTYAGLVSQEDDIWWFAAGFIAINVVIRIFISKYPLRIYRNVDKYIAVFDSQLPLRVSLHQFAKGDVAEVHNVLNPWSDSMFRLGNRTSLLLIDYFKTPAEFSHMLGLKS